MFDPATIVGLLAAGAMAKLGDVGGEAVSDAYQGLKALLVKGYKFAAGELLEKKPNDKTVQETAVADIAPEALKDQAVLEAARKLQSALAAAGVTIEGLTAQGNVEMGNIQAGERGVAIKHIGAGKDIKIGDVTG
jgi:hypothetical protein